MDKKFIILTWLSLFSLSLCSAKTKITINNNEIEKIPYKIEAVGIYLKVTFDDNSSIMSRMDDTIVRIDDPSGIKSVGIPEYYSYKNEVGDIVKIDGLKNGDNILLYSGKGVMLSSSRSDGNSLTLDMSKYASGIYVLKINNKSIKFIK